MTDRYLQTGPSQLRRSQPITLSPLEMFVGGYQQSKIGKLRTWTLPENPNNDFCVFLHFAIMGQGVHRVSGGDSFIATGTSVRITQLLQVLALVPIELVLPDNLQQFRN